MVRAKFTVSEHRQRSFSSATVVILRAQYDGSIPDDMRYAKATPSGSMEMEIDNPDALACFPLGSVHYIEFTPATA